MSEIERRLNAIPWFSARAMTPAADALAREHCARMKKVFEHLEATAGKGPLEAYADAQSAGYAAEAYEPFLAMLFKRVSFGAAPSKNPLILSIASHFFWGEDPELGALEDPWAPMMELYALGYTSTFDQDDTLESLDAIIEYQGGTERYVLAAGRRGAG